MRPLLTRSCVIHLARLLNVSLMKMGRTGLLAQPHRGPQAGKSGDPRSQNTDSKANGKWRLCIDLTDLNKACPKDPFHLPCIDPIVDSTSGYELLSFLDAYSGYHQIFMSKEDEEKTSFITPCGTYYFMCMPFRLKSARSTFARAVQIGFES